MNSETAFDRFISEKARSGRKRIGIGILHPDEQIVESLTRANEFCEVIAFGEKAGNVHCITTDTPEIAMLEAIASGDIDAIVRGQAVATVLRTELARRFSYPPEKIKDLGVVKDRLSRVFIPLAISNSQGWTLDQKIQLIREAVDLLGLLNLPLKVGVTSGARPNEMGSVPYLAETFADAEKIVSILSPEMPIKHYYIDIEKVMADGCSILVFANGMVGNHVLRSLVFLGRIKIYGGIISGIDQLIVESFKNSSGFYEYLEFTNALANLKK
jgi:predicted methyltransferase MtxX (methanogen marker protein 4)